MIPNFQNDDDDEEEDVFASPPGEEFPPQSFETVDIMMQPQGVTSYEPGFFHSWLDQCFLYSFVLNKYIRKFYLKQFFNVFSKNLRFIFY